MRWIPLLLCALAVACTTPEADPETGLTPEDTGGETIPDDTGETPVDTDVDDDGYDGVEHGGTDCDDTDASVHPGAPDTWYDGVDSDCDGWSDYDADRDSYDIDLYGGEDCDDTAADIHPGAADAWYDGVDSDCDGADDFDLDGDGHSSSEYGGDDCDDYDGTVWDDCPAETLLDDYSASGSASSISSISDNLSGITWNPDTGTYLAIRNNDRYIHELSSRFSVLRSISLSNLSEANKDLEDIAYLGSSSGDYEYALVAENGKMFIGVIEDDSSTTLDMSDFQVVQYAAAPASTNKGGEGVAWDEDSGEFWVCLEKSPMIVYTFARPSTSADVSYTGTLSVTQPFDAQAELRSDITDISSCYYDPRTERLLILSDESSVVLDVDPDDGSIWGSLPVDLGMGNKPEGITVNDDEDIVIAGEANYYRVYAYSP